MQRKYYLLALVVSVAASLGGSGDGWTTEAKRELPEIVVCSDTPVPYVNGLNQFAASAIPGIHVNVRDGNDVPSPRSLGPAQLVYIGHPDPTEVGRRCLEKYPGFADFFQTAVVSLESDLAESPPTMTPVLRSYVGDSRISAGWTVFFCLKRGVLCEALVYPQFLGLPDTYCFKENAGCDGLN